MEEIEILEFGIKRENEERRDGGCSIVFDPISQKYAVYRNLKNGVIGLFGGGFDEGEDEREGALRELREESGLTHYKYVEKLGNADVHYHNSNKNVNRVARASFFLVILETVDLEETHLESHENFKLLYTNKDEILSTWNSRNQNHDYDHWIYFFNKAISRAIDLGYDKVSVL